MSMIQLESRIREAAYAIWEQESCPDGCEAQHWERAVRQVLASGHEAETPKVAAKTDRAKSAGARGRVKKVA